VGSFETKTLPSSKAVVRGIQGFILFSVTGTLLGWWWKRPAGLEALLSHLDWWFVALLFPLICVDYFLGGFRYRLFFDGKILPHVSLWNCMRSNWANIFMGAATPFQTGGGPAQLYILWCCGAKISDGALISLINFAATLIFFLVSTIAAALLVSKDQFGENFALILLTGFVVIGSIIGLVLLALIFPTVALARVRQLLRLIPIQNAKFLAFRERLLTTFASETQHFRRALAQILQCRKWSLAMVVVATLALFFNKYLMGYVIARALGQSVPFGIFIGLQIIQLFLIYYAPTPGASGVAELSSVWLMGKVMPTTMLLIYTVLWRFVTTLLGAVIGGFVLLLDIRFWTQRTLPGALTEAVPTFAHTTDAPNENR